MAHTARLLAVLLCSMAGAARPARAMEYPGPRPGPASARQDGPRVILENAAITTTWKVDDSGFSLVEVADRASRQVAGAGECEAFTIHLSGGRSVKASQLRPSGKVTLEPVEPRGDAPRGDSARAADHFKGWRASVSLVSADAGIRVHWQAVLLDESNYVRQQLTLQAEKDNLPIERLTMIDLRAPGAKVLGTVDGSPVVAGNLFFACEHPLAAAKVLDDRAACSIEVFGPLRAGQACTRSCALGVAPAGQLRRGFLYYLERQRARPYQPFLHYNSWYDIAWGDRKMDEAKCLAVIEQFGRELVEKRGVTLDSLVFDDGWDDNKTLWRFHDGFPRGFTPLQAAAAKYRSGIGVWLSPWGGYDRAKKERLEYGKSQGFETNRNGFSLAGPKYYARFRDACRQMIAQYKVNYFKFDGIAQGLSSTGPSAEFARDVESLLQLLVELRRLRGDVYLSVTTGTWPSPFWLLYGDSIWRSGGDMGFFGPGSKRQQWITYRDMIEYQWVVCRGPLYPLNSLMTQGIAQAQLGDASKLGSDLKEFQDEVRSFFASGTQLQELYVTPQMLTAAMWDALAEAARWSRRNADVLVDVHWIGGDPGKGQPYGFAAWSRRQGMLSLRNPTDRPASMPVDVAKAFELPPGAPQQYRLESPWNDAAKREPIQVRAGRPHTFTLAPFEVLVFDATPDKRPAEGNAKPGGFPVD